MADTTNVALSLLKANLGYYDSTLAPAVEEYLGQLLETAEVALAERGIVLDASDVHDALLQSMYAGWLYRKAKTGEAKPPMLRDEIRDRQVRKALRPAGRNGGADT